MSLTITGIVAMLLGKFMEMSNVPVGNEEITSFISTGVQIIGAAVAWYGRFRIGDINIFGLRKGQ